MTTPQGLRSVADVLADLAGNSSPGEEESNCMCPECEELAKYGLDACMGCSGRK